MMDDSGLWPAGDGHPERVEHELRAQLVAHRPPYAAATEAVDYRREEQLALPGRHVGVGSDRGAVSASRPIRLPGPPSEPDAQLSLHPALHEFVPRGHAVGVQGVGIFVPR
jgi:hypothetical protein